MKKSNAIISLMLIMLCLAFPSLAKETTNDLILTNQGIGFIQKNTSWHVIQQKLSKNYQLIYKPSYMVDSSAIEVKSDGKTLFAILIEPGKQPSDNTTFSTIIVENNAIKTAEGIGVGSFISDAVKVYGPVTLNYNYDDESREYAVFEHGPKNIIFRTGSEDEAGIYTDGLFETKNYKPMAKIKRLIVKLK